jgi:hypothetical protein
MALQRIDTAFGPNPVRFNGNIQPQANANVFLGNTGYQFSTIYAATFSGTATHANLAYNLASGTAINPSSANVSGNIVGYATTVTANVSTGAIVSRGGLGVAGVGMFGGNLVAAATTTSTSTTTGALVVAGGVGAAGNLFVGGKITGTLASGELLSVGDISNSTDKYIAIKSQFGTLEIGRNGNTSAYINSNMAVGTLEIVHNAAKIQIDASDTVTIPQSTVSTSTTTGALVVSGGVGIAGRLNVGGNIVAAATTISTSTTTGAIVSRGGVGVAGAMFVGGIVDIVNNTQATSTTTGALTMDGGASIGGSLFIGGSAGNAIIVTGNIIPSANLTATNNLGSDTRWWNNFYGVSTQARYADLAENYQADADYEPGTVLEFGGLAEVTIAEDGTRRVAGVVSTNPAHLMNTGLQGVNVVPIALQGRTPCKVRGKIQKGDMLISAGSGFARPDNNPQLGSVIGKALVDFDGHEGTIEVVVGRL